MESDKPHLHRVLGFRDLVLLGIVAVFNLNLVPPVAAGGFPSLTFWCIGLLCFLFPQGVAVAEFATRYPEEGGIYLWTKKTFGELHGFLCGWFYWTTNVFYIPTLLVYLIGIVAFEAGPRGGAVSENVAVQFAISLALLWLVTIASIRGLRVNQWMNNLGGMAAIVTTLVLIGVGIQVYRRHQGILPGARELLPTLAGWRTLSALGVICLGLVGLELGSIMGDEIREPRRTVPRAALCAGLASGLLYVTATFVVLLALPVKEIGVVTGVLQAFASMGAKVGLGRMHLAVAVVLAVSIFGALSAWLSGGGRIPFVAGVDHYLPAEFSRLHRKWRTPHTALTAQAVASSFAIAISFAGQGVKLHEAYEILLALAVLTQMIPFVYLFGSLVRVAGTLGGIYRSKLWLWLLGLCGLVTTLCAMATAFIPPGDIPNLWRYEAKVIIGLAIFCAIPAGLFRHYSERKAAALVEEVPAA
jgi:glutamate:GABA antiporter